MVDFLVALGQAIVIGIPVVIVMLSLEFMGAPGWAKYLGGFLVASMVSGWIWPDIGTLQWLALGTMGVIAFALSAWIDYKLSKWETDEVE